MHPKPQLVFALIFALLLALLPLQPSATTPLQAAPGESCPAIAPVTLNNPTIVGDGTAASCTQAALAAALAGGGQIAFNCGSQPATISITSELSVSSDTLIDGGGLVTLDGNNSTRLLNKGSSANLTVQNISIVNGKAPGPNGHFSNETGGAILARGQGTTLTVINATFANNSVTSLDSSDIAGGAIYAFGLYEAVIANSTFSANQASNGGAIGVLASGLRIYNSQFLNNAAVGKAESGTLRGHGGAINMDGVTNSQNPASNKIFAVCGSRFEGNTADNQGGATNTVFSDNKGSKILIENSVFVNNRTTNDDRGQGGAIFHVEDDAAGGTNEDNLEIRNATFAGNSAFRQGGAVWFLVEGRAYLENLTFFENRVDDPALGMGGAVAVNKGDTRISNVTFARNYAWFHGGGLQAAGSDNVTVTLSNSIFYYNEADREWAGYQANRIADVDGGGNFQFPPERYNQANNAIDVKVADSAQFADPLLGPLADNGGPTPTMALLAGSPAIDAGTPARCRDHDQRLLPRPIDGDRDGAAICDSGAYEVGAAGLRITALSPAIVEAGSSAFTLTVHGNNFSPQSVVRWNGTDLPTTFVDNTRLTVAVAAGAVATVGDVTVTVYDPTAATGATETAGYSLQVVAELFVSYLPFLAR